jgi:hypothetical protein
VPRLRPSGGAGLSVGTAPGRGAVGGASPRAREEEATSLEAMSLKSHRGSQSQLPGGRRDAPGATGVLPGVVQKNWAGGRDFKSTCALGRLHGPGGSGPPSPQQPSPCRGVPQPVGRTDGETETGFPVRGLPCR